MRFLALPSPAKLNLFLHIQDKRKDGYHNIQTVFQLLDFEDHLSFRCNNDAQIRMITHHINLPEADNLIIKAAQTLQAISHCQQGCAITLDKKIPMGAGLGGGSSNAATTLLALNKLWNLNLSLDQLANIGVTLGADIPLFIHGYSAWAEGIGDQLTPLILPQRWYCLLLPPISIDTQSIFQHPERRRHSAKLDPLHYKPGDGGNDLEAVITSQYPQIGQHLAWLRQHAPAHITGTGSTIFASFDSEQGAKKMASLASQYLPAIVAKGLNHSSVHRQLFSD